MANQILDGVKKALLPIVIGVITYPVLTIFQYKGLIVKAPTIKDNKSIIYKITAAGDPTYKKLIITFNTPNSSIRIDSSRIMYLSIDPFDRNWAASANSKFGDPDNESVSTFLHELKEGNYFLSVPVISSNGRLEISPAFKGSLVFSVGDINHPFTNFKAYQWYYWVFFNRWKAAILALTLTLLIQFIVTKFKKK